MWKTEYRYMNREFNSEKCISYEPLLLHQQKLMEARGNPNSRYSITTPTTLQSSRSRRENKSPPFLHTLTIKTGSQMSPRSKKFRTPSINDLFDTYTLIQNSKKKRIFPNLASTLNILESPRDSPIKLLPTLPPKSPKCTTKSPKQRKSSSPEIKRMFSDAGGRTCRGNRNHNENLMRFGLFKTMGSSPSWTFRNKVEDPEKREELSPTNKVEWDPDMLIRMKAVSTGRADHIKPPPPKGRRMLSMEQQKGSSVKKRNYIFPLFKGNADGKAKTKAFLKSFHKDWQHIILTHDQRKRNTQRGSLQENLKVSYRDQQINKILQKGQTIQYPRSNFAYGVTKEHFPILSHRKIKANLEPIETDTPTILRQNIISIQKNAINSEILENTKPKKSSTMREKVLKCIYQLHRLDLDPSEFMNNKIISWRPYEKKHSREFILSCKHGNLTRIQELLEINKYLVYDFDHLWQTGLMWAVKRAHMKLIQFLLKNKVDVNSQDLSGRTALYHAAKANDIEIVKFLLAASADPFIKCTQNLEPKNVTTNYVIKAFLTKAAKIVIILKWTKGWSKKENVWRTMKNEIFQL